MREIKISDDAHSALIEEYRLNEALCELFNQEGLSFEHFVDQILYGYLTHLHRLAEPFIEETPLEISDLYKMVDAFDVSPGNNTIPLEDDMVGTLEDLYNYISNSSLKIKREELLSVLIFDMIHLQMDTVPVFFSNQGNNTSVYRELYKYIIPENKEA